MRYDSADNYQAGVNVVVSNPGVLYKSRAEDGDDVDVLKMAGELAVASQWGCDRSHFIADEDIAIANRVATACLGRLSLRGRTDEIHRYRCRQT